MSSTLDHAAELEETRRENELLRRQLQDRGAFGELVGNSDSIRKIYTLIEQVAPSSSQGRVCGLRPGLWVPVADGGFIGMTRRVRRAQERRPCAET